MTMMKREEEEVMKLSEIITETSFTTAETESTLLVWALNNLNTIPIDIHMLKTTGIGKVVNHLRKHQSDRVSEIAMGLIKKWKAIVHDVCEKTTVIPSAAAAAGEPTAPTSSSRSSLKIRFVVGKSKPQPAGVEINKEIINIQMHRHQQQQQQEQVQEVIAEKENGGMNKETTAAVNVNTRINNNRTDKRTTETSPAVHSSIKVSSNSRTPNDKTTKQNITTKKTLYEDEAAASASAKSLQSKLETSKRKLYDSYQQFEIAKKQKIIKVIDYSDVLKPSQAAAAAAGTNSKTVKSSKQAAISKRLNLMKRNHLHRSKVLLPY